MQEEITKKTFQFPQIELIVFNETDVITSSGPDTGIEGVFEDIFVRK